ncbi:MAG: PorV/PorQ family protein, partial [Bacteroidia bacterium]
DSSTDPNRTSYYIPTNKSVASAVFGSFADAPFSEELREIQISLGAEYWYQNQFAVRAGYFYEDKTKGDRKYLTLGVGVRYKVFQLNGSYLVPSGSGITRNPLSNTFRFSLMFEFDKIEKNEE